MSAECDVDVCVIGGGFVGLHTSLSLSERASRSGKRLRLLLLESGRVGGGASGRCAGMALSGWQADHAEIVKAMGAPAAAALHARTTSALALLDSRVRKFGIECGWRPALSVMLAPTLSKGVAARFTAEVAADPERRCAVFHPPLVRLIGGGGGVEAEAALVDTSAHCVGSPLALAQGLASALTKINPDATIRENTPVLSVTPPPSPAHPSAVVVTTRGGAVVTARAAVVCTPPFPGLVPPAVVGAAYPVHTFLARFRAAAAPAVARALAPAGATISAAAVAAAAAGAPPGAIVGAGVSQWGGRVPMYFDDRIAIAYWRPEPPPPGAADGADADAVVFGGLASSTPIPGGEAVAAALAGEFSRITRLAPPALRGAFPVLRGERGDATEQLAGVVGDGLWEVGGGEEAGVAAEVRGTAVWFTPTEMPLLAHPAPGVWVGTALGGHGIVPSVAVGEWLADCVDGSAPAAAALEEYERAFPPRRVLPEALAGVGVAAVLAGARAWDSARAFLLRRRWIK